MRIENPQAFAFQYLIINGNQKHCFMPKSCISREHVNSLALNSERCLAPIPEFTSDASLDKQYAHSEQAKLNVRPSLVRHQ